MKALKENLILGLLDIKYWKKKYRAKQIKKNPNISIEELDKKIKNAKRIYFNRHHKKFDVAIIKNIQKLHKEKQKKGER